MTEEALFVNLKVLSKLDVNQKLNTTGRLFQLSTADNTTYVYINYIPEFVRRWLSGNNRENNFNRIRDLIKNALTVLQKTEDKSSIVEHLKNALIGLDNYQKTYENDLTFSCRVKTLTDEIRRSLGDYVDDVL